MGIRVHKAIGYGLDTLRTKPGKDEYHHATVDDPRFDWQQRRDDERTQDMGVKAFSEWIMANEARLTELIAAESPVADPIALKLLLMGLGDMNKDLHYLWQLGRSLIHQDEFGLPGVLLVIDPPSHQSWYRYDNTLDWTEETELHNQRNRVIRIQRPGIYPYDGRWKRIRPASEPGVWQDPTFLTSMGQYYRDQCKFQDEHGPLFIEGQAFSFLTGRWDPPKRAAEASGPLLAHLLHDYRPSIPAGVLAVLLAFEKCFPLGLQPILDDMRPLLYVWWG